MNQAVLAQDSILLNGFDLSFVHFFPSDTISSQMTREARG